MTKEEFKNIFNDNFDNVRNYIYYRCGDTELATDVAQETFAKVWEKQFRFKDGNVKGLLFKISSNIFISNHRKQKTAMNFCLNLKEGNSNQNPEELMQFGELQKSYDEALGKMPEKQRVVFLMHRNDKLKYYEIAERLDLSVKAIEKRMKYAIEFLRKHINN